MSVDPLCWHEKLRLAPDYLHATTVYTVDTPAPYDPNGGVPIPSGVAQPHDIAPATDRVVGDVIVWTVNGALEQTWSWNGATWVTTHVPTPIPPPPPPGPFM